MGRGMGMGLDCRSGGRSRPGGEGVDAYADFGVLVSGGDVAGVVEVKGLGWWRVFAIDFGTHMRHGYNLGTS